MGSNYFGEPNLGNERGGSSRKGKKSNSDKPKQPQRGLGVAQLEKIRIQTQLGTHFNPNVHGAYPINFSQEDMRVQAAAAYSSIPSSTYSYSSPSSSSAFGFHPSFMMGLGEYERNDMRYGQSSSPQTPSWDPSKGILDTHDYSQPGMTRHFLQVESEHIRSRNQRNNSLGSSSQNSESSDSQDIDLELKLSL